MNAESSYGSDPLPFQLLAHYPAVCQHVMFIDVDYPQLIAEKADIIRSTPQIHNLLTRFDEGTRSSGVNLSSDQYHAIGCDLSRVDTLERLLEGTVEISQCMVLCTAEVSITYMNVAAADALITWAARYDDSMFGCAHAKTTILNI